MTLALISAILAYIIITIIVVIIIVALGEALCTLLESPIGGTLAFILTVASIGLYIISSVRWFDLLFALFL